MSCQIKRIKRPVKANSSGCHQRAGSILAADQLADGNTTDAITGFQLTVEHGGGTATTLYVDNVTVPSVAVPEPASLGLLGTVGMFFMKRRKH